MDFKYDSNVMHKLVDATNNCVDDTARAMYELCMLSENLAESDWDDNQRDVFAQYIDSLRMRFGGTYQEMLNYIAHIKELMSRLENRS